MDVIRIKQRAYIEIAVLRESNAREYHNELVQIVGNNARPQWRSLAFLNCSTAIMV
jgi:hypothetical protein